jgi:uridylate kinase
MARNIWVISLGGSRIISEGEIDVGFIQKFKKIIFANKQDKFIVVTGGGSTARKYIKALKKLDKSTEAQSKEGIAITRMHASFLSGILGKKSNLILPKTYKKIGNLLNKNKVVVCGALQYKKKNTSDGTAAGIAAHFKTHFINITNISGLYTSDPTKNKSAKFIKNISWKNFHKKASKIKYSAGQHFVLDQSASKIILKKKIPTYIISNLNDLPKIFKGKSFSGTLIQG